MSFHFEYRRYRLAFRSPVRTARGIWPWREGLVLRLESGTGAVGWGEAAPVPGFGTETVDEAEEAARGLGGRVGESVLGEMPGRLGCLRSGLAGAFGDIRRPEPAGGTAEPASLSVAALLPAGREALLAAIPRAEAGFRVFKWKVGVGDPGDELALLDDLLAALPAGSKLRLDANGAWNRRTAERWLDRCADRPIEFVEQPVAADAGDSGDLLLGLAGDYPTPIALDESIVGAGDAERWLGAGWRGIFVVKPSLFGDPEPALGRLAAANARVVFSSALETAVGARAALRTAFAWPGARLALGFGVWPLFGNPEFDGPAAAPFLRREDLGRINPEAVWTALG